METIQIIVKGRVQGVAFRYHTKAIADEFALTGTVQNNPDGSVKILATGSTDKILRFLDWVHVGSPASMVTELCIKYLQHPPKNHDSFQIIR